MTGLDLGQDFRTALREDPRLDPISDGELDGLLEVRGSLGSCAAFVDRVRLTCAGRPRNRQGDERSGPKNPRADERSGPMSGAG
jgi:hypothetical protein